LIFADPGSNHSLGDDFAKPDSGIKAFSNDIGQAIIDHEFYLDVGVFPKNIPKLRP